MLYLHTVDVIGFCHHLIVKGKCHHERESDIESQRTKQAYGAK